MSRTVLVVDDEPDILMAAGLMLEAAGCTVIEAGNGEEALELAVKEKADVEAIFLDLRMRGLNGWGISEQLRANGVSRLPVIVLSAYCDPVAVEKSAELGAWGYLSKPFRADDLRRILGAIFESPSAANPMPEGTVGTP
jgi:CheY-like chemotaxis protein